MDKNKIYIVGVLDSGERSLTPDSLRLINQAEVLIGSRRLLSFFPATAAKKHILSSGLSKTLDLVRKNLGRNLVVLLASGDPNFFGISRYMGEQLGKERTEIIPNLTSLQLAFARIKEPWDDAVLVSAHARPIETIVAAARKNSKLGILTDDVNTPAAIARALLAEGLEHFTAFVGHNLGGEKEKVSPVDLKDLSLRDIPSPNVLILLANKPAATGSLSFPVLGIPDEAFERSRPGLITKMEIRAISLAKLALSPSDIVWDIGSGSGSVAIEAARLCPEGRVYAIEKDPTAAQRISQNRRIFGAFNLTVVSGEAPEALASLENPDGVFIGGSGGRLKEIMAIGIEKLKPVGRLVANVATLENLHVIVNLLHQANLKTQVTLVNIARSQDIQQLTRLEPLSPIFIVSARKT